MYISGKALCLYHILQLLQQHGVVVEEPGCWIGLPAIQIFHLEIIKRKIRHGRPQQLKPISGKNGAKFQHKTPDTHNLDAQMS